MIKLLRFIIPVFILIFVCNKVTSQYLFNCETGVSTFFLHKNSHENLRKEWGRQEYIQAYKIGFKKRWHVNNVSFETGPLISIIGANHIFTGKWRYLFTGITFGTQYKIGKASLGLRSAPSIALWNNWPSGFDHERTCNFDLEPNVSWDLGRILQITAGVSYGINPSVKFSDDIYYRHVSYLLGVNYMFVRKSR